MEVGSREEAECLTFHQHVGGDTLDAFAPLSHYTHRVHNDQVESTWTKVSRTLLINARKLFANSVEVPGEEVVSI